MTTVFVSSWLELKEAVTNPIDMELEIVLENDVIFEEAGSLPISKGCQFIIKSDTMSWKPSILQIKAHLDHRHFTVEGALCLDRVILDGGGLLIDGGYVNLAAHAIVRNGRQENGGGVFIKADGRLDMMPQSKITHNTAKKLGGGVYLESGACVMEGGCIQYNQALEGGGIYNQGTVKLKQESQVQFNEARRGGALYNLQTLNLSNQAEILENQAFLGGGIYNLGRCQLKDGAKVGQNSADTGGGIYHGDGRFLMMGQPLIEENAAKTKGGGFYMEVAADQEQKNWHRSLWIGGATFQKNTAAKGGGLHVKDDALPISIELEAAEFLENTAQFGGAIYLEMKTAQNRAIGIDPALIFQGNMGVEPFECLQPEATPFPKSLYGLIDNHHVWVSREGSQPMMGPLQSFADVFPDPELAMCIAKLSDLSVEAIVSQRQLDQIFELDVSLLEVRDFTGLLRLRQLVNLKVREEQIPWINDCEDIPHLIVAQPGPIKKTSKGCWFKRFWQWIKKPF